MTPKDRQKLKKKLPPNYCVEISERLCERGKKITPNYVYMVFAGLRNSNDIIDEAITLAKEMQEREKEREEFTKKL